MKKLWDLKKVFSNLEPEGQGRGIVIGVTRLLLLGPFYTIQTQTHQTFLGGVCILNHFGLSTFFIRSTFKGFLLKIKRSKHDNILLKYTFVKRVCGHLSLRDQTVLTLMLKVNKYLVKIHVYSSEMVSTYNGDIVLPIHFPVFGPVPPNHFANRLNANVQSCYCCCFSASRERESLA